MHNGESNINLFSLIFCQPLNKYVFLTTIVFCIFRTKICFAYGRFVKWIWHIHLLSFFYCVVTTKCNAINHLTACTPQLASGSPMLRYSVWVFCHQTVFFLKFRVIFNFFLKSEISLKCACHQHFFQPNLRNKSWDFSENVETNSILIQNLNSFWSLQTRFTC